MASGMLDRSEAIQPFKRPDSPDDKSGVKANATAETKTPAFEKDYDVAIMVKKDGRMSKKVLFVATVNYSTASNKYKYQLKEKVDSESFYESGKWYEEGELKDP